MLNETTSLDPSSEEFQILSNDIRLFLLGENPDTNEGGALTTILADLKEHDALEVAEGRPTKHYETFTRTVRDFSPEVARRIDYFEAHYQQDTPADGEPASPYKRAIIEAGLPEEGTLRESRAGEYAVSLPDGAEVTIQEDGNHLSRSISMDGVDYPLETPIEQADINAARSELITVQQNEGEKLQKTKNALTYLENPRFADTPFEDMKPSLLQILGHALFDELGVRGMTDKQELISNLKTNAQAYQDRIKQAKENFHKESREAVARVRERYRENDEKLKQALRVLKYSGLADLGVDYLMSQIRGQMVLLDI